MESDSVCNHTSDLQSWTTVKRDYKLFNYKFLDKLVYNTEVLNHFQPHSFFTKTENVIQSGMYQCTLGYVERRKD